MYDFKIYECLKYFADDCPAADVTDLPPAAVVVVRVLDTATNTQSGVKRTVTHRAQVWLHGKILKRFYV